jgi:hypothetical protein
MMTHCEWRERESKEGKGAWETSCMVVVISRSGETGRGTGMGENDRVDSCSQKGASQYVGSLEESLNKS